MLERWSGSLWCVLGHEILLSQCLSPHTSINGYIWGIGEFQGQPDKHRSDKPATARLNIFCVWVAKMLSSDCWVLDLSGKDKCYLVPVDS